ncbi:hypothetical protein FRC10_012328 [Ceratobasidium sp. 414]|nr:hypothetical protein FRC10_012328 [Ceratobasidium sp. 414]
MEYSHSLDIIHRDLKPELVDSLVKNILLTDTVPRHAKVADFGLAKAIGGNTLLKTFCGTPIYLAPEVVLRQKGEAYTRLVDSWSIGVIVWFMLTNTVLFTEDNGKALTRFQRQQVDWSQLSGFSNECIDWVKKMLVLDPTQRMSIQQALDHPWLADLARAPETTCPPRIGPSETTSPVVSTSSGGFVFSDPELAEELSGLERFSDSLALGVNEAGSALRSASRFSGAGSAFLGATVVPALPVPANSNSTSWSWIQVAREGVQGGENIGDLPRAPAPTLVSGQAHAQQAVGVSSTLGTGKYERRWGRRFTPLGANTLRKWHSTI